MNLEFFYLITIFSLLVLIITFGDSFEPSGFTYPISTSSNSISTKSIISLDI